MHVADQTWHFAQFRGNQDLALVSTGKANDLIFLLQLRTPQQQTAVNVQVEGTCFVTMIVAFIFTYVHFSPSNVLYRVNKITSTAISTQFILHLY